MPLKSLGSPIDNKYTEKQIIDFFKENTVEPPAKHICKLLTEIESKVIDSFLVQIQQMLEIAQKPDFYQDETLQVRFLDEACSLFDSFEQELNKQVSVINADNINDLIYPLLQICIKNSKEREQKNVIAINSLAIALQNVRYKNSPLQKTALDIIDKEELKDAGNDFSFMTCCKISAIISPILKLSNLNPGLDTPNNYTCIKFLHHKSEKVFEKKFGSSKQLRFQEMQAIVDFYEAAGIAMPDIKNQVKIPASLIASSMPPKTKLGIQLAKSLDSLIPTPPSTGTLARTHLYYTAAAATTAALTGFVTVAAIGLATTALPLIATVITCASLLGLAAIAGAVLYASMCLPQKINKTPFDKDHKDYKSTKQFNAILKKWAITDEPAHKDKKRKNTRQGKKTVHQPPEGSLAAAVAESPFSPPPKNAERRL